MDFLRTVTKDLRFILFQRCGLCGIYDYLRIQLYDLQIYKSPSTLHRLALFLHVPTLFPTTGIIGGGGPFGLGDSPFRNLRQLVLGLG
jgi:hypothetical protein